MDRFYTSGRDLPSHAMISLEAPLRRAFVVTTLVPILVAADVPAPTWTVEQTPTSLTISSTTPKTFKIVARATPRPGELLIQVDVNSDGQPEAGTGYNGSWNNGLAGSYTKSCTSPGFMAEFETIRWFPTSTLEGVPHVLVEHFDDGNVHIVFDAERDGHPEADVTTEFELEEPKRAGFCKRSFRTRPSVGPRPG